MVRPRRCRYVWNEVGIDYFKPKGVELKKLEEVNLKVEEFEAIRLNDFLETEQIAASDKMKVSQPTYSRILKEARKKIADALINGKAIKIHGGVYKMPNKDGTGPLGNGQKTGRGMGNCQGKPSDMLMPIKSGGGPHGKGLRFQKMKDNVGN